MQELISALANPGAMSSAQWILLGMIMLLAVLFLFGALYVMRLLKKDRNEQYMPNIGRQRLQPEKDKP
jgi:flagellar biogenesis protein FliO